MVNNIKKLLRLPTRTNNERIKIALGISNLNMYLLSRLLKLNRKYVNLFNENWTIYDKIIENEIGNNINGIIIGNNINNII